MTIAVLSDIHANLEALDVVLEYIERCGCDRIICLGDVVGYGPNPNECIERLRMRADRVLLGNHDHAAIGLTDPMTFNRYARQAIEWTGETLTPSSRKFLQQLPATCQEESCLCVHASPYAPLDWRYISSVSQAALEFRHFDEAFCFIGHSHVPLVFCLRGNRVLRLHKSSLQLERQARYIINVGSVGQPRDGNPQAAVGIWRPQQRIYELCRLDYDFQTTQKKMRTLHMPAYLVERIAHGR
ncbi:metallophosphoesterase family protein [candidate division KSB1 bacterium]|nr:metallophosphoesterase family protein [candidate division KSB1 bacterium]